jgi:hypothetical protein
MESLVDKVNCYHGIYNRYSSIFSDRFVYEIGGKCIYQNLPGNFTMVNNHREGGENYDFTWGAYARLLSSSHLQTIFSLYQQRSNVVAVSSMIKEYEKKESVDSLGVYTACLYFPDWRELVLDWQYDFNGHQLMKLGTQNPYPHAFRNYHNYRNEIEEYVSKAIFPYQDAVQIFSVAAVSNYALGPASIPAISAVDLIEYRNMLVGILPPVIQLHYFEYFPLLQILSQFYSLSNHYLYTSQQSVCEKMRIDRSANIHCIPLHAAFPSNHPESTVDLRTAVVQLESNALIITIPLLSHPDTNKSKYLTVPSVGRYFEYIVIYDSYVCASAPTEIQLFGQTGGEKTVEYLQIGSLCDVSPTDHGIVIYRYVTVFGFCTSLVDGTILGGRKD